MAPANVGMKGQNFEVKEGSVEGDPNPRGRRKKTLKARIERLRYQVEDYGDRVRSNTATPLIKRKLKVANADLRAKVAELELIDIQVAASKEGGK